jgi:hypothetical protein
MAEQSVFATLRPRSRSNSCTVSLHDLRQIALSTNDVVGGSRASRLRGFRSGGGGTDHQEPVCRLHLREQEADPASGGVDDDDVASLERDDRIREVMSRHPLERTAAAVSVVTLDGSGTTRSAGTRIDPA